MLLAHIFESYHALNDNLSTEETHDQMAISNSILPLKVDSSAQFHDLEISIKNK